MESVSKILIVGYGSMGRRRIRLASELIPSAEFICVDSNPIRRKQASDDGHISCESLEEGIKNNPDIAFVCTSPGHHADIIIPLIKAGIHVFTELNLTNDKYEEIARLSDTKKTKVFVSSTLIYKRQMEIFREIVSSQSKPVSYIYHVGQYLPDWHPWESYKDFFIGKKDTNGIREILAIQLPWMVRTFGRIKKVHAIHQRCTDLDIDFPDNVILGIEHENGNIGTFAADVVSRKATTRLEIIGEDVQVLWNGHNDDLYKFDFEKKEFVSVKVYDSDEHIDGYSDNISEEPYKDEIREFLKIMEGHNARYGLNEDAYILHIIDEIENSY